jgi:hypothetical protein
MVMRGRVKVNQGGSGELRARLSPCRHQHLPVHLGGDRKSGFRPNQSESRWIKVISFGFGMRNALRDVLEVASSTQARNSSKVRFFHGGTLVLFADALRGWAVQQLPPIRSRAGERVLVGFSDSPSMLRMYIFLIHEHGPCRHGIFCRELNLENCSELRVRRISQQLGEPDRVRRPFSEGKDLNCNAPSHELSVVILRDRPHELSNPVWIAHG